MMDWCYYVDMQCIFFYNIFYDATSGRIIEKEGKEDIKDFRTSFEIGYSAVVGPLLTLKKIQTQPSYDPTNPYMKGGTEDDLM